MLANAEQSPLALSAGLAATSYRTVTGVARVPGVRARLRRTPLGGVFDLEALHALFRGSSASTRW